jgi:glycerol-3-phosphate dehydrogenase subunit C
MSALDMQGMPPVARGNAAPAGRMRPHDVRRTMDNCTKCGICQAHCPVAAATEAFPGPKYSGPQAQRFRVIGVGDEFSASLCSGCGICSSVCPNDVAIADIIALAKPAMAGNGRRLPLGQRLLNRPDLVGRLGNLAPWLGNLLLEAPLPRRVAEKFFGIDREAPLPRFAGKRFERWFARQTQPDGPAIGYFPGCAVAHYDSDTGIAAVRLLHALGYRVAVPSHACCALPMLSSGEWGAAAGRARHLVDALAPAAINGTTILATSTSCSLTLRSKYAAYLDMVDEHASAVADAVSDICGFLLEQHGDDLARRFRPLRRRVLYHGPCQLRGHRLGLPAAELMARIPDLELVLSEADCCGVAGTYGYDRAKRPIAERVGMTLVEQVRRTKPDLVVCDSETCRWNIAQATGIGCIHPVELLAEALTDGQTGAR